MLMEQTGLRPSVLKTILSCSLGLAYGKDLLELLECLWNKLV